MTSNSNNSTTDSLCCSSSGGTDSRTSNTTNINNNMNLSSNQENHIQCAVQSTPPLSSPSSSVCALTTPYDSRIISGYPRLGGLYGPSYSDQNSFYASGANPFYSSFGNPYDLKDANSNGWAAGLPQSTCYLYDPIYNPYGERYGPMDGVARRKNVTRDSTTTLKAWLNEHRKNPYPTKGEKIMLAIITKMTLTQVSTWFANARRRLKKENKMTWEPRNRSDGYDSDDNDSCKDIDDNSSNIAENMCLNGDRKDSDSLIDKSSTGLMGLTSRHTDSDSANSYPLVKDIGEKSHSEHIPNGHESKDMLSHSMNNISRAHSIQTHLHSKHDSTQNMLDGITNMEAIGQRPKIWSLAQTAIEDKPKSPLSHFNHNLNPNVNLNPFLHLSANIHATALSAQTPPNMSGWCHPTHSSVSPYTSVNPYGSHYMPSLGRHFAHPSATSLPPQADTPPQTPPGLKLAQMQLLSAESGALATLAAPEQVTCVESHKLITYGNRGERIGRSGTGSASAGNTSPPTHSTQIYGTDFRINSDTLSEASHSFSSAISSAVHLQTQDNSHNNDNNSTNHK